MRIFLFQIRQREMYAIQGSLITLRYQKGIDLQKEIMKALYYKTWILQRSLKMNWLIIL